VIEVSLTSKERRALAEIENVLAHDDPGFAARIDAINHLEGDATPLRASNRPRLERRVWLLLLGALAITTVLVLAVLPRI
jgi:hypothetical protein